ncbi:MAG TPA: FUSC family protein [Thermoleophilaceae bacterium]|nr:FUSC family protein [Thermoleophilaceae bacterium]
MANVDRVTPGRPGQALRRGALLRLRVRSWPILQTAVAAVVAWYLATLLVSEDQPVFAAIAAVVSLGATYGQRPERAIELVGGVVLGIGLADLIVRAIGSGPLQLGLLVLLAMGAAVALGGGPLLVTEAAVSASLLVLLEPTSAGLAPSRLIEAVVGGGVALAVSALAFPPNPVLLVGRSAQAVFGALGRTLEDVAAALAEGDRDRSDRALEAAREIDRRLQDLDEALAIAGETARFSPGRRSSRGELDRYARAARHVDYAVRNARVLARHAARFVRSGRSAPPELLDAIHDLGLAVWALAAELDEPGRNAHVRIPASRAATRATESFNATPEIELAEIVAQVRSIAIDLVRAAEVATATGEGLSETPTEELLVEPPVGAPAAGLA